MVKIDVHDCHEAPWFRGDWYGDLVSLDGTANTDFTIDDVETVIAYGDSGDGWDGNAAGVSRLKDGRIVSWESNWGPTGSGFSADAYGGGADIHFSASVEVALKHMSEQSRELLKFSETQ